MATDGHRPLHTAPTITTKKHQAHPVPAGMGGVGLCVHWWRGRRGSVSICGSSTRTRALLPEAADVGQARRRSARICGVGLEQDAGRVPGALEQLLARAGRQRRPDRSCRGRSRSARRRRRSGRAPDPPRPRPSAPPTSASLAVTHGMPRATQLPKKMSANDSPTSALMPQRSSACGACSRDEPQPKFLLTTATRGPFAWKRGSSMTWPFELPVGVEAHVVERVLRRGRRR